MRPSAPKPLVCYLQALLRPPIRSWHSLLTSFPSVKPIVSPSDPHLSLYDAWLSSRSFSHNSHRAGNYLSPGAHRTLSTHNVRLALFILRRCALQFLSLLWELHPWRVVFMISLDLFRGIFPAFRGYSQALIIDELQALITSSHYTWSRLVRLLLVELCRTVVETLVDSFATTNESVVHNSVRFVLEYKQMEQRIRMDVPTLSDPIVRDLLHESDLFVRSCGGVSSFGLLSPFDFLRICSLLSELLSHALVLYALSRGGDHRHLLLFFVVSSVLPSIVPLATRDRTYFDDPRDNQEARMAAKQERMRSLAHSDPYRPEIMLFGLGPWILQTWATARRTVLGLDHAQSFQGFGSPAALLTGVNIASVFNALQNLPLVIALQSSSTSLGAISYYRNSIQCLFFTSRNLLTIIHMAFQSVFLLGAFGAAMEIEPHMQPKKGASLPYKSSPKGTKLEIRNLSYYYPNSTVPALRDVTFNVEAGETVAIVGPNGSGKSTLANILLRIADFHEGQLLVNGNDIRQYQPSEFHQHITAVFQGFSKFDTTVKENIGVGYVPDIRCHGAIERAAELAGASSILLSLPNGLKTTLDTGFDPTSPSDSQDRSGFGSYQARHGLSGGEWQRVAISRAFMRAHRPEVELLIFDEPTSSLDAHAQNRVFDTVARLSRSPSGERTKTVIFITHRLSTARRADKIAMMEHGTVTEFGTHEDLLRKQGSYAALYQASV